MQTPAEFLTLWTVRLAVLLYVLALCLRLLATGRRQRWAAARLAWTVGCVAYLIHVACAFQFYHHWSHAAAYTATAQQTAEVVGWDWGGGLYVSYVFSLVWLADVVWWWRGLERYETQPRAVAWTVQVFLAFIVFNATVVFGTGAVRWFGVAGSVLLIGLLGYAGWQSRRRVAGRQSTQSPF